jgi:hypothetical protein
MKKLLFPSLVLATVALLVQCASMPPKWPIYERAAEDMMTVIQQKIGDGLKTGALTPDEAQIFLARLEGIRKDYLTLREQNVHRSEWESLLSRLSALEDDINKALARHPRVEGTAIEDRLSALQRRIDDERIAGRLTQTESREFQGRLDTIRSDYLRMTESGRFVRPEDRTEISRRLDLLEIDIDRYR